MPKRVEYPRLRTHRRVGKNGQVWISYSWDGRGKNSPGFMLGNDYEEALRRWAICEAGGTPPPLTRKTLPVKVIPHKKMLAPRLPKQRREFPVATWAGLPEWAKRFFLNAERRAGENKRAFWLKPSDLFEVIARAGGRCEVSGVELCANPPGGRRGPYSPSIDRIDCKLGYVPGNIRVVCLMANLAMNEWGEEALKDFAKVLLAEPLAQVLPL